MSIPSTYTETPTLIPDQPSWEKRVQLDVTWKNNVTSARDASEQRITKGLTPYYRIRFTLAGLDRQQFPVRRAAVWRELRTGVCVPMWPRRYSVTVGGSGLLCSNGQVGDLFFKRDRFAVWMTSSCEVIGMARVSYVTVSDNSIALDLTTLIGTSYLDQTPAFLYPCVCGNRMDGAGQFIHSTLASTDEVIYVEDL